MEQATDGGQVETKGEANDGGRFLAVEHAVASILAETSSSAEAYPRLLEAIADALGWEFGAVWEGAPGPAAFVRCTETWCAHEAPRLSEFARTSRGTALPPGHGLPGRVWSSGVPAWIADVQYDPNFPRSAAAVEAGLRAGFCFPIRTARGVLGAIELLLSAGSAVERVRLVAPGRSSRFQGRPPASGKFGRCRMLGGSPRQRSRSCSAFCAVPRSPIDSRPRPRLAARLS
jgi:GAF domain